jgi:cell division transport system permease protein
MILFGFVLTTLLNAKKITDSAKKNVGFTLFLDNNAKSSEITELQNFLQSTYYTDSLKFVSKEKAAAEMESELGEDFIDFLGNNPLPNSFEVRVKSSFSSADSISAIRTDLERFPIIREFFWEQSLVKAIDFNLTRFNLITSGLFFIFILIIAIYINHTIKLSVIENGLLKLPAFNEQLNIKSERKKLLISGITTGTISASITSLVLVISLLIFQPNSQGFLSLNGIWLILIFIFIFAVGMSGISAYFAVKKYLPETVPESIL